MSATTSGPDRPKRPILVSLVGLLLVVGVLPLVVFGLVMTEFNREQLKLQQDIYQLTLAESLAREVSGYVEARRAEVLGVAELLVSARRLDPDNGLSRVLRQDDVLAESLRQHPHLLKLVFVSSSAEGWAAAHDVYRDEPRIERVLVDDAFSRAMRGLGMVSNALSLADGRRVVVLSVPVSDGGEPLGMVSALLSLDPLERTLSNRTQKLYTMFVVDSQGGLIAHSGQEAAPSVTEDSALLQQFLENPGLRTLNMAFETRTKDGGVHSKIGAYATADEVEWGAFVELDEASAYSVIALMKRSTRNWASGAVLLAVLLGTVFASRLARPLRQLALRAQRIALGHYDERITLSSSNEIGLLAHSFNDMGEAVQDHVVKLQQAARENKELFMSTVRMLAEAIDAKDPYTRGHSERVTRYAVAVGRRLGLSDEQLEAVQIAALLHDVGEMGIDDRILRKPSGLTHEEFEIMKQHPEKGAQIMGAVEQLKSIIPGMRFHHEKVDGSGYPLGLVGDEIPISAQVISVADTFDAVTKDRPYQKGMEPEYVLGKLKGWVGQRFRADVVEAFELAFRAGEVEVSRRLEAPVASQAPTPEATPTRS